MRYRLNSMGSLSDFDMLQSGQAMTRFRGQFVPAPFSG